MLKIKLQPVGKKNQRLFRIVVAQDRSKLTGRYIDLLGHYNPHHPTNKITIKKSLYKSWIDKGARPTDTVRQLVNKSTGQKTASTKV